MSDAVNTPQHYTSDASGIECIEVVRHRTFNIGNAIKYLWRAGRKESAIEDMNKAIWYVCDEIKRLGGELTASHPLMEVRSRIRANEISRAHYAADIMEFEGVLLNAFGVTRFEEIQVKFLDHVPNAEVVIPLMRAVGGRWAEQLKAMEDFTKEQKAKLPGAGVGAEYVKEAEKAVERA